MKGSSPLLAWRRVSCVLIRLIFVTCYALSPAVQSSPLTGRLQIPALQPQQRAATEHSEAGIQELVRQKRWKAVAELAEQLTLKNPNDSTDYYWLGIARFQLGNHVGAVQALRCAEKLGVNSAVLHEALGLAYYSLNQFFLFEQQMAGASELAPHDPRPAYYLGLYYLTVRSDVAKALKYFEDATRLRPEDAKSGYEKGKCLEDMGRPNEARQSYADAIRLVEKQGMAYGWPFQGMARLLLADNPQQALGFAKKAVETEPRESSNHLILAQAYQRLGNVSEAIHEAQTAAEKNPTGSAPRYLLFKLYQQTGDHQAANAELKTFEKLKALYGPE